MDLRRVLVLFTLGAVGCTGASPVQPDNGGVSGQVAPEESSAEFLPAGYQAEVDLEPVGANEQQQDAAPAIELQLVQLFQAVQQLQVQVEQLQKQNSRLVTALGMGQDAEGPPPPGSLAARVDDLHEAVTMLALDNTALHRSINDKVVALRPALQPPQGRLTVENNTDRDQQMWINGTPYWIWANTALTVEVPVGQAVTKVDGEPAQTWTIEAPDYHERIELIPATAEFASPGQ